MFGSGIFGKVKVLQIGCGKMAKYTMRYVFDKGGVVVAGIDINPELHGKDIGTIIGDTARGALIYPVEKLEEVIKSSTPNIAVVETMSLLSDVGEVIKICVNSGVSVITTCEEAFFPFNSNPKLTDEIDTLAKQKRCTVTGCGYQDIFWGNLISTLAGSTHKITTIKGSSSYNVEDYGLALAEAHGAGLTLEEFDSKVAVADKISTEERKKLIEEGKFLPSYMWNTVGWLADKLHLKITSMEQKCIPITSDTEIHSDTLNMDIPAGNARGMSAVVTATTEEGIILEAECVGKVYTSDEVDVNTWTVYGEPDTTLTINKPQTVELTCADVVNRIPDVLNADYGFIPTSRFGEPKYLTKPLKEYINK